MSMSGYMNSFLVQESISIMFVALGLAIIGFSYARVGGKEFMKLHRSTMTAAVILTMISVAFVMIPSLYLYYFDQGYSLFSAFSYLQIAHSIEAVPTLALTGMYLTNRLPQPTKRWMRITAVLWLVALAMGAVVYYTMPS